MVTGGGSTFVYKSFMFYKFYKFYKFQDMQTCKGYSGLGTIAAHGIPQ